MLIAGFVLQLTLGSVPEGFLPAPWGAVLALVYVYALVALHMLSARRPALRQFFGGRASVVALAAVLVMLLIFGLVPQSDAVGGMLAALGFNHMRTSWIFCLLMFNLITGMGLSLVDDLWHLKTHKPARVLAHFATFIIMLCGMFGSGDKMSVRLEALLDQPASTGIRADGHAVDLPFMLTLKSFDIEQYAPKIVLRGESAKATDVLELGTDGASADLGGWRVTAFRYFEMAMPDSTGTAFRELRHLGAEPAAFVEAVNLTSGQNASGWVSRGSFLFADRSLALGDGLELGMDAMQPRKFASTVDILDARGKSRRCEISVNHPARVGAWRIYQNDYDTQMGRWSTVSGLQCVRDPWYPFVRVGLWLVILSSVVMFMTAGKSRKS